MLRPEPASGWRRGQHVSPDCSAKKEHYPCGADADFVVFDPHIAWTVTEDDLHFRHKISPYLGSKLRGRVQETWLRGERIFHSGQCIRQPTWQRAGAPDERSRKTSHRRVSAHRNHYRGTRPNHPALSHPSGSRGSSAPASRMESLGMSVHLDAVGNLRGLWRPAEPPSTVRRLLGSHIDTVPDAGAFDGVLGVVLALELVESAKASPSSARARSHRFL